MKHIVCELPYLMGKKKIKSVAEVSRKAKLAYRTVYKLFKNESTRIDFETTYKLCKLFDCRIDELYKLVDESEYERVKMIEKKHKERNRKGVVYFIKSNHDLTKIGKTSNLKLRLNQLEKETGLKLTVIHTIDDDDAYKLEQDFHERFSDKRVYKEWFSLNEDDFNEIKKPDAPTSDINKNIH